MYGPGPWMPNSMVKLAPDNKVQGYRSGYDGAAKTINCFSHIHEWTMAGLGMMPTVGALRTHAGFDETSYGAHFDPATEHGGIGFYEVDLHDGIKAELTATTRASLQRYTFPASNEARVLYPFLLPNEYEMHILKATVRRTGNNAIEGTIETDLPKLGLRRRPAFRPALRLAIQPALRRAGRLGEFTRPGRCHRAEILPAGRGSERLAGREGGGRCPRPGFFG